MHRAAQYPQRRKLEDAAWRVTWSQHRYEKPSAEENVNPKPRADWGSVKVQEEHLQELRKHHRQQSKQRQQEDERWRLNRKSLREQITLLPIVTAWIAVLMLTDNCTRQCLGLPLFIAGSHVTAEMVVAAVLATSLIRREKEDYHVILLSSHNYPEAA